MKQTAVEQLGIAFRQWEKDWDNFENTGKYRPLSYDKFIEPFLEMEKEQIIEARVKKPLESEWLEAKQYYNEQFKNKQDEPAR